MQVYGWGPGSARFTGRSYTFELQVYAFGLQVYAFGVGGLDRGGKPFTEVEVEGLMF